MKRSIIYLVISVMVLLASCSKEDSISLQNDSGKLVSIDSEESYTPRELASAIANSTFSKLAGLGGSASGMITESRLRLLEDKARYHLDTLYAHREGVPLLFYKRSWHIESYTFKYLSVSSTGSPVILSGRVTMPMNDYDAPHQVNSLSLCSHPMEINDGVPSNSLQPNAVRALFNSAVIEPDYQGYGANFGSVYPGLSFLTLGRQMMDCAKAAIEVMREHGVTLASDYYSTAWGYSAGAPASIGLARYYDEYATSADRELLRLKAVSTSCGDYLVDEMLLYFDKDLSYNAALSRFIMPMLLAVPLSTLGGYEVKDFMPSWAMQTKVEYGGMSYTLYDAMSRGMFDVVLEAYSDRQLKDILAEDMCTDDGHLDFNNLKTLAFINALHKLSDWGDWMPSMHIYMTHGRGDDRMPYEQARLFYAMKAASGKMHFKDLKNPVTSLLMGETHAALCTTMMIAPLKYEDPAKVFEMAN
ncbi:MAG: hypothetical protein IJR13_03730 [Bacteroidales bacterium]|nr:hypothetical protein [Bacteroidales bacterium]